MIYTPFVWLLLISAFLNGGLAYYASQSSDSPMAKRFRVLTLAAACWALMYGFGISLIDIPLKLLVLNLTYIPSALTAIAMFAVAAEYAGRGEWLTRPLFFSLFVPLAVFEVLAFTWSPLWRYDYQLTMHGSLPVLVSQKGVLYWLYIAYMVGLCASSFFVLILSLWRRPLYFRNTVFLSAGALIPVAAGLFYALGLTPLRGFDWTPVSFTFTALIYSWAVTRGRLLEIAPIERNFLIEHIQQAVIALNERDVIIDFNRAAQTALGLSPALIGAPISNLPSPWADVFARYAGGLTQGEAFVLGQTYEIRVSPMRYGTQRGRVFLLYDLTQRKQIEEQEKKQRALAKALQDTAEALTNTLDYETVLEKILVNVGSIVPLDSANIAIIEKDGQLRYIRFIGYERYGASKEELEKVSFSIHSSPIFKKVVESGEPHIISDTHKDPDWVVTAIGAWIRSYAVIPLRFQNNIIGVLNLDSSEVGRYTDEHIQLLRAFAGQAAIAIENARLYAAAEREIAERKEAELKERRERLLAESLHASAKALSGTLDYDSLLREIFKNAQRVVSADRGNIVLKNENGDLRFVMLYGYSEDLSAQSDLFNVNPDSFYYIRKALQSGEPIVIPDTRAAPHWVALPGIEPILSYAAMPIRVDGEVVGVLNLDSVKAGAYALEQIDVLRTFADHVAAAVKNARLYAAAEREIAERKEAENNLKIANAQLQTQLKQIQGLQLILREQAIRDPLTGLYNRRYLHEAMEREVARAIRRAYPIALALIDLDHFKQINDQYGHETGDVVLKKLAAYLLAKTRAEDIICRYGGEEFLAALPNASAEDCFQAAEKWREEFGAEGVEAADGRRMKVTFSCGIAEFPQDGQNLQGVIARADQAMYIAKRMGRDRVEIWRSRPADSSRDKI